MRRRNLLVVCLGLGLLGPVDRLAPAQTLPAIPEPGLVMYGSVVNTNLYGSSVLAAGAVNWTISGSNSAAVLASTIVGVNGQYFYIARVPFETRHAGTTV